jgi:phospholipase D1/2
VALGLGVAMVALYVAWRWTPLAEVADPKNLLAWAETLRGSGLAAVIVPLSFVALTLALFPITVLRVTTVIVFGPLLGPLYAILGVALGALVGHALGVRLGSEALERLAGKRVVWVRERLEKRGLWAIAALRLVPLGPFMLVNAVGGAARLRRRDFVLGTVLGMTPGLFVWALLSAQIEMLIG